MPFPSFLGSSSMRYPSGFVSSKDSLIFCPLLKTIPPGGPSPSLLMDELVRTAVRFFSVDSCP